MFFYGVLFIAMSSVFSQIFRLNYLCLLTVIIIISIIYYEVVLFFSFLHTFMPFTIQTFIILLLTRANPYIQTLSCHRHIQ